jgi:hypothetical protein
MATVRTEYTLEQLIDIMSANHLRRLHLGGIDLEMDASGFERPEAPGEGTTGEVVDDAKVCTCGHGIMTEHSEHGCLHGCSIDICAPLARPQSEA